jgi:hypothetical protein
MGENVREVSENVKGSDVRTAIVVMVDGIEFHADGAEDEPRVLDLEIGERVGLARPRKVRDAIRHAIADGAMREGEHFRREILTPSLRASSSHGGHRKPEERFWLTEAGALKLITRLRTPEADAMVDEVIRVYRIAIRQLAIPASTPDVIPESGPIPIVPELVNAPKVGDSEITRREMGFYVNAAKMACGVSVHRVHGVLRREFNVCSPYRLSILVWPHARALLESLGMGRLMLPSRLPRKADRVDPKQQKLWS